MRVWQELERKSTSFAHKTAGFREWHSAILVYRVRIGNTTHGGNSDRVLCILLPKNCAKTKSVEQFRLNCFIIAYRRRNISEFSSERGSNNFPFASVCG
jgi:hypothetical protein